MGKNQGKSGDGEIKGKMWLQREVIDNAEQAELRLSLFESFHQTLHIESVLTFWSRPWVIRACGECPEI